MPAFEIRWSPNIWRRFVSQHTYAKKMYDLVYFDDYNIKTYRFSTFIIFKTGDFYVSISTFQIVVDCNTETKMGVFIGTTVSKRVNQNIFYSIFWLNVKFTNASNIFTAKFIDQRTLLFIPRGHGWHSGRNFLGLIFNFFFFSLSLWSLYEINLRCSFNKTKFNI